MRSLFRFGGATTVFVAVMAAGHLLNSGGAAPGADGVAGTEMASAAITVTDVTPTLGMLGEQPRARRGPTLRIAEVQECEVAMSATRRGAGLALLAVSAPCRAGERMTVQHDALSFTIALGEDGRADVEVPALAVDAVFFAFFDDAAGAMAEIRMPEIAGLERAGLMWQGGDALGLHASEFGAPFGADGHVWAGAPGAASRAMAGEGGFITRLGDGIGDGAQTAEIYTFPARAAREAGSVEIALEALYDEEACGRAVAATAFRAGERGVTLVPVSLALPDCDTAGAGGFVQLNGSLEPITLASD